MSKLEITPASEGNAAQSVANLLHQCAQKCAGTTGWVATYTKADDGSATLIVSFPPAPKEVVVEDKKAVVEA